jgi:hypothetical protein
MQPKMPEQALAVELDALLAEEVRKSLTDPSPPLPQHEVFATLRAHHARRTAEK